ncbi:zinc finger and SCAN domain-containing protein 5C-like [Malaya genurostris]|uniref:zinc finger and SCAN domain-containing protein 5C-like n=1 Tax=Malaya genurostris TaxID=325434 RepID=UPI0026F3EB5E|nr:zinc finger and SCAN domain-containing protein 5C-like [Malaya genurostris]
MDKVYKELVNLNYVVIENDENGLEKYSLEQCISSHFDQYEQPEYHLNIPPVDAQDFPELFAINQNDLKELYSNDFVFDSSEIEISPLETTLLETHSTELQYDGITPPSTPDLQDGNNCVQLNVKDSQNYNNTSYYEYGPVSTDALNTYGVSHYAPTFSSYPTPEPTNYTQFDYNEQNSLQHYPVQAIPTPEPSPEIALCPDEVKPASVSEQDPVPVSPKRPRFTTTAICSLPTENRSRKRGKARVQYDNHFYCAICDRTFGRISGLKQHNKFRHSGPRKYRCTQCGKRYQFPEELEAHEKRHSALTKPFPCSKCPKQFHYRMDLERHFSLNHGEVPFRCSECGKGFARGDHLSAHMVSHRNHTVKGIK